MKNPKEIKAFAVRLRILREEANMSQDDLAYEADISKKTVQRIENAGSTISFDTIISLAKGLNIPLTELVDLKESAQKRTQ